MMNVLTFIDAASILTSEVADVNVPPVAKVLIVGVPTVSGLVPTVIAIFTTASVVTPYSRRPREISAKDKVAREMEEEMAREDQRLNEQIARDAKIARIHVEEELKMMIDGLDRSNEMIAKHLHEYEQAAADLTIGEKIELINELRYDIRGDQRKVHPVWKQIEDFVPISSKEEAERFKRKGLRLEQGSAKNIKTSEEVSEEDLKEMMQLVPVEEMDREDLNQLWALVKETLSIRQASSDNEKELCVELKRLFEPNFEDQMWTHTQALMYDPLEWRLYDTCSVYHVFTKDQEIFMLVERDYLLRKGLAIVMISNKLQGRIVGNKMIKSFPLLVVKIPLLEYFPTTSEEVFPLLSILVAPAEEVCTAVYSPPKKDMSWTGLPEFADDTITDYSRPSPSIESNTSDLQNSNSSVFEPEELSDSIMSKPMINFVKASDSPKIIKTHKVKTARKPSVRYAEMYRNTSKRPNVRGNQRNWNNLKS
nr:hypothetical protein [Tanacetum cinerariifolium]